MREREGLPQEFGAGGVMQISLGQQKPVDLIDSLRLQERLQHGSRGLLIPAIDQQIVRPAWRINEDGRSPFERQDGQARGLTVHHLLQAPAGC